MPLHAADLLMSTAEWRGEEVALYLTLLCYQWAAGSVPADLRKLCKLVRFDRDQFDQLWPLVSQKFIERDGRLINEDMEELRLNPPPGCKGYGDGDPSIHWKLRAERLAAARGLGTHTKEEWQSLLIFCGHRCVKCGSGESIEKDHITPLYLGGSDSIENLQPLCQHCNVSKGADCTDHRDQSWRSIQ